MCTTVWLMGVTQSFYWLFIGLEVLLIRFMQVIVKLGPKRCESAPLSCFFKFELHIPPVWVGGWVGGLVGGCGCGCGCVGESLGTRL